MKGYPQPLSEAFVYSSPEHPAAGSFRWIGPPPAHPAAHSKMESSLSEKREIPHGVRHPN
ncbi:MAG: hypothetical protein P8045_04985 [Candidatus Thiodiazotropha sp.]